MPSAIASVSRAPRLFEPRLFEPRLLGHAEDEVSLELVVDRSEPYLADHAPGGQPLLGTVMCLEVLASACACVAPGEWTVAEDVCTAEAFIPRSDNDSTLLIELSGLAAGSPAIEASLYSVVAQARRLHMRARFPKPARVRRHDALAAHEPPAVS